MRIPDQLASNLLYSGNPKMMIDNAEERNVEFVLNNKLIKLQDYPADTTLLRFLRDEATLCGTKEGCASGDCGACTVLAGKAQGDNITYQNINACITPLGAMHGKHVVTVEHLQQGDRLHPVQQAFVDCHASQCGFCTPGFVMSVTAWHSAAPAAPGPSQREQLCRAISGNLCRCTGYRPILEAGITAAQEKPLALHSAATEQHLREIASRQTEPGSYFRPRTLAQWQALQLRHPEAPAVAGGTDLVLDISTRYRQLPVIIDVSNIEELHIFTLSPETTTLGAALSYADLEDKLQRAFPHFTQLLARLGSPQIRHRGTLGGNIANASPVADTPPVFLTLDARLNIVNSLGEYRSLPLSEFYLDYKRTQLKDDELIVSLCFPTPLLGQFHRFYKITKRHEDDIASVMAAFRFSLSDDEHIEEARIAYGGMAATPLRVEAAEQCLTGKSIHDTAALEQGIAALQTQLKPIGDVRASEHYRRSMAVNLLRKAWLALGGNPTPSIYATPLNKTGTQRA